MTLTASLAIDRRFTELLFTAHAGQATSVEVTLLHGLALARGIDGQRLGEVLRAIGIAQASHRLAATEPLAKYGFEAAIRELVAAGCSESDVRDRLR